MSKEDRYSHLGDEVGDGTDGRTTEGDIIKTVSESLVEDGLAEESDTEESTGDAKESTGDAEESTSDAEKSTDDIDGVRVTISSGDEAVQFQLDETDVTADDLHEAIRQVDGSSERYRPTWGRWIRTASTMQRSMLVAWAKSVRASTTSRVAPMRRSKSRRNDSR